MQQYQNAIQTEDLNSIISNMKDSEQIEESVTQQSSLFQHKWLVKQQQIGWKIIKASDPVELATVISIHNG